MTTENDDREHKPILPADLAGFREIFDTCARLVAASPNPRLASVSLLNVSLYIALEIFGRKKLENDLRGAIANLEMAEAKSRGGMT